MSQSEESAQERATVRSRVRRRLLHGLVSGQTGPIPPVRRVQCCVGSLRRDALCLRLFGRDDERTVASGVEVMSSMFSSLAQPNYRIYAIGTLISNIGTWMFRTALTWMVLVLTGSGTAIGVVAAALTLPTLIFSPLAGVLADRFDKRRGLIVAQIAMAMPVGVMGVLALFEVAQPWHAYVLAFGFGAGKAFEAPIRQSFVVELVGIKHLANAVALNSASFNSGRLVGPGIAGLLIAWLGSGVAATGWVIIFNFFSFFAVFVSLTTLDLTQLRPSPRTTKVRGAIREGIRYVRDRSDLVLVLAIVFFVGTFAMNFQITSALMVTEVFNLGAKTYGVLGSIVALGSLAGALIAARRANPTIQLVIGSGSVFALLSIAAGLMPNVWSYAVLLPFQGLSVLLMMTSANSFIQLTTGSTMRGRISSLYLMVFWGGTPLGGPFIGWVGETFGGRWSLIVGGCLALAGIVLVSLWHRKKQVDSDGSSAG